MSVSDASLPRTGSRGLVWLLRGVALLLLCAGIGLALWLRTQHIEWSADAIRDWIESQPLAPLAFVTVLVLRPFLLIPSSILMAVGGALFGVVAGTLLGTIGGTVCGIMLFSIARSLGREFAERRLGPRLRRADAYLSDRATLVALYTAFPATPLGIAQVATGLSGIRARSFALATVCGMLPRTALLAWFGDSLAQAQWARAAIALLLLVALLVIGLRMHRRRAA